MRAVAFAIIFVGVLIDAKDKPEDEISWLHWVLSVGSLAGALTFIWFGV